MKNYHLSEGVPDYDLCLFCARVIHEAYQFLTQKLKKLSGRSMQENWLVGRRKSTLAALTHKAEEETGGHSEQNGREKRAMSLFWVSGGGAWRLSSICLKRPGVNMFRRSISAYCVCLLAKQKNKNQAGAELCPSLVLIQIERSEQIGALRWVRVKRMSSSGKRWLSQCTLGLNKGSHNHRNVFGFALCYMNEWLYDF